MPRGRARLAILVATLVGLVLAWLALRADRPRARSPRSLPIASAPRPGASDRYEAPWRDDAGREPSSQASIDDPPRPFRGRSHVLPNGLTVVLVPDPASTAIAARIVVRAGAVDDPPGGAGTAHFLEHLLFQGTDRLGTADWPAEAPHIDAIRDLYDRLVAADDPEDRARIEEAIAAEHAAADGPALPNEYARLYAAIGVTEVNAFTTLEHTVYSATVPPDRLEAWARVEAERLVAPVLRNLPNERRVVIDEVRVRGAHGDAVTDALARAAVFGGHPYGRSVGGTQDSVADVTMRDLEAFWTRWYAPGNTAVVLVGPFDPGDALDRVAAAFGDLPPGPVPTRAIGPVTPTSGGATSIPGSEEGGFHITWAVPDLDDRGWAALSVAAHLVEQQVRRRQDVVGVVRLTRLAHGGEVALRGYCFRDDRCVADAVAATAEVRSAGVSPGALAAARWGTEIARLESLESADAQADVVVRAYSRGADLDHAWAEILAMRTVESDEVRDVSRRVFGSSYAASASLSMPLRPPDRNDAGALTDLDEPRTSAFFDAIAGLPRLPPPDRWLVEGRDYTALDGVVAVPNPYNHLFQLDLSWPMGWATDPMLCHAVERWEFAASDTSRGAWAEPLWRIGVTFRAGCDEARTEVTLKGPEASVTEAVALLREQLAEPVIGPPQRTPREPTRSALESYALYGANSPYLRLYPTRSELEAASTARLEGSIRALGQTRPEIGWVGVRDAGAVSDLVGGGVVPLPPAPTPPQTAAAARVLLRSDRVTRVRIVRWGEPYDPDREGFYALADKWLSGSTGIVSEAVRERHGSAYMVIADYERGAPGEPNLTTVSIMAQSARVTEAVGAVIEAMSRPPTGARWDRLVSATEASTWSGHIRFRSVPQRVLAWRRRGLSIDAREAAWTALGDVDEAAFAAFVADEARVPLTVVVHGDTSAAARAGLERIAPVRVMTRDEVLR